MKRILALICVLACLCGFALPALAAPDVITVTAQVPEDWTNVHLYTWIDDTNNLATWPGTAMKKGNDGRWTLEIPSGYPYLIINNGDGGAQTVDTPVDGISDVWVIVGTSTGTSHAPCDVEYADPGIVEPGNGGGSSEPAALTSMALVGEGNDALKWEPDNADCAMTKSSDGVYTKELTMYKGATIQFKFCGNGAWDAGYDFGGSEASVTAGTAVSLTAGGQNLSYTATQDCTLTVTLDMNGDAPSVTVTEKAAELAPPPEKVYVKLYVSVAGDFTPSVWAWGDNGDAFPTWPGQAMTKSGDWWVVDIPNDCHSVLINDGVADSNVKTSDLNITMGAENWIVVAEDWTAQVSASEPTVGGDSGSTDKPSTDKPSTDKPADDTTTDGADEDKGGINPFVIVTIVLAVAAVGAVVVTVIVVIKKKKA